MQLKPGGRIPEKGKKITLYVKNIKDLSRDVIKVCFLLYLLYLNFDNSQALNPCSLCSLYTLEEKRVLTCSSIRYFYLYNIFLI